MRNEQCHFPHRQFGEALEHFKLALCIERRSGFIEDQQLRVAQVSAGQRYFLPLATRKIHAAIEAPAKHLLIMMRKFRDHLVRQTLLCRSLQKIDILQVVDPADGDVLSCRHLVSHEILER